jgi:hypothetical protein
MTARVPSGCAGTISHRARTLIVSRLPTCSADLLECCARNARGTFGLTQTIPRGATVGARLHRVNAKFRRPTSGLRQVATADPASMADGATVSSPSVIRPSRISGPRLRGRARTSTFCIVDECGYGDNREAASKTRRRFWTRTVPRPAADSRPWALSSSFSVPTLGRLATRHRPMATPCWWRPDVSGITKEQIKKEQIKLMGRETPGKLVRS